MRNNSSRKNSDAKRGSTSTAKSSFAEPRKESVDINTHIAYESDESDDDRSRKNSMALFVPAVIAEEADRVGSPHTPPLAGTPPPPPPPPEKAAPE